MSMHILRESLLRFSIKKNETKSENRVVRTNSQNYKKKKYGYLDTATWEIVIDVT